MYKRQKAKRSFLSLQIYLQIFLPHLFSVSALELPVLNLLRLKILELLYILFFLNDPDMQPTD